MGLKVIPHSWEALWQRSEEQHCLFDPISLSIPLSAPIPIKKRVIRLRESQALTHPSSLYKMSIRPEVNWNASWPRKHRSLLNVMMINRSNWPGSMRDGKHRWLRRLMPPFKKSSQLSSANLIKLLPWCVSSTVPLHYMRDVLPTTTHYEEHIPSTITVPKPDSSPALGPSDSPACPTGTLPLPVPPYQLSLLLALPLWDTHLLSSLPVPPRKSGTALPVVHSAIIMTRGPMLTPKILRLGVNTALHMVMKTCPNWYQRPDLSLNNEGRNLPTPLLVQLGPTLILMTELQWEAQGVPEIRPHPTQTC